VKGRFLLNVVVGEGTSILELLSSKDETLLVRGDAFLVLDLSLDRLDGVGALNFQSDGLAREGLDEDLHSTTKAEHQVKGGLLLDVVVAQGASVLKLFSSKDQTLLVRGDAFLVLDLSLHALNGVGALDFESNCLSSESFDEDLQQKIRT
jgi:hypothetical protein